MPAPLFAEDEYTVWFDEDRNLVRAVWHGVVDKDTILLYYERLQPILDRQGKVLYFNDFSKLEDFTISARWVAAQRLKTQRQFILKSAICGTKPTVRWLYNHLNRLTGRSDVVMFDTADEALNWLLDETTVPPPTSEPQE